MAGVIGRRPLPVGIHPREETESRPGVLFRARASESLCLSTLEQRVELSRASESLRVTNLDAPIRTAAREGGGGAVPWRAGQRSAGDIAAADPPKRPGRPAPCLESLRPAVVAAGPPRFRA